MILRTLLSVASLLLICHAPAHLGAAPNPGQAELESIQTLVGQWRGVGQPRRGSTVGAWRETAGWEWDFSEDSAALVFSADQAHHLRTGRLEPAASDETRPLRWTVELVSGQQLVYHGMQQPDGTLSFVLPEQSDDPRVPDRIALRVVAGGDRLVMALERRVTSKRFGPLASIGYTREGGSFAPGDGTPECVVTGGRGSMAVTHEGQTVYVCCGGCRDAFLADPVGILADYAARRAKQQRDRDDSRSSQDEESPGATD